VILYSSCGFPQKSGKSFKSIKSHSHRPDGVPSQTRCNCRHLLPSISESGNIVFSRWSRVTLDAMLGLFSLSSAASSGATTSSGSKSCSRSKRRTRWRKCCESMAGSNSKLCLKCLSLKVYRTPTQQRNFWQLRDFLARLRIKYRGSTIDSLSAHPAAWERHMLAEGPWWWVMVSREAPRLSCTANPETPRQGNSMHINVLYERTDHQLSFWENSSIYLHISTCPSKYLFTNLFISTYTYNVASTVAPLLVCLW